MRTPLAWADKKDYLCYAILRLRAGTETAGRVDSNLPICEQKQRYIFFQTKCEPHFATPILVLIFALSLRDKRSQKC